VTPDAAMARAVVMTPAVIVAPFVVVMPVEETPC
jgi:hypothetical protein